MSGITSLSLPSTLKRIGELSISVCFDLTEVNLPASVEEISESLFCSCLKLQSVTFDKDNKNFVMESNMIMTADKTRILRYIGAYDENETVSVSLPSTVKKIDKNAFDTCNGLKEITLPEGLESIGILAFSYTGIYSLTIPSTVKYIGTGFAEDTKNLKTIVVAEGNENFKVVDGVLYDADMTTLLKAEAGIKSITIPETVTTIRMGSINYTDIKTLVIPDTVKELQDYAVTHNAELQTVIMGSGLEILDGGCLGYNDALQSIYMRSIQPVELGEDIFFGCDAMETATLYVPEGSKELYSSDPNWGNFKNIEEYSLTGIDNVKAQNYSADGQVYGIDGVRRNSMRRGLNIVRSCGKARKVIKN